MNITTINKALKHITETKKLTAIKASGKGKYYIKNDGIIAFFTIENNAITSLKFTTEIMSYEIFSCLYSFELISYDAKIIIDNKEYNFYECEKMFGFLDDNEEELLKEIKRINKHIEKAKKNIENNNIKLKELINNGYTDKEIKQIEEEIEYYKKRLNNKEQLLKVLNEMIEELEKENEIEKIELKKNEYENVIFEILKSENTKIDYSNGYELKVYNNKESFKFSVAKCYFTEEMTEEYTFDFTEGPNKNKRAKINIYTENYDIFVKEFNKEVNRLINK